MFALATASETLRATRSSPGHTCDRIGMDLTARHPRSRDWPCVQGQRADGVVSPADYWDSTSARVGEHLTTAPPLW